MFYPQSQYLVLQSRRKFSEKNEQVKIFYPQNGSLGLVGKWRFDGGSGNTAYDSSGYGNHGLLGDGVAANMPLWTNKGLSFDGTNDYINAGTNKSLANLGAGNPATFSFWMNPSSPLDNIVMGKNDNNNNNIGWWIENIQTVPTIGAIGLRYVHEWSAGNMRIGAPSPTNGIWTHVVVVSTGSKSASGSQIYYNGINQTLTTSSSGAGTTGDDSSEKMYIGNNRPTSASGVTFSKYKGVIGEIEIYNRDLSASEIMRNYNATRSKYV